MSVKTYDQACYELAEYFLREDATDPDLFKKHCHSLALEIQQVVEDWTYEPAEKKS